MQRTRMRLRSIPGLLVELDLAIAKLVGRGDGSGLSEVGQLDFDPVASDAALAIRTCVHGWVRIWDEETPCRPESAAARTGALGTAAGQAGLLAGARLASRPWVPELAEEIRRVTEAGWRAVDTPPDVSFVGWCPDCPSVALYAAVDAPMARCRGCGQERDARVSRDALLAAATGQHETAAVLARALRLDPALIRQWRRRGRLEPVGVNGAGQPLYAVSDVSRLATARPAPGAVGTS